MNVNTTFAALVCVEMLSLLHGPLAMQQGTHYQNHQHMQQQQFPPNQQYFNTIQRTQQAQQTQHTQQAPHMTQMGVNQQQLSSVPHATTGLGGMYASATASNSAVRVRQHDPYRQHAQQAQNVQQTQYPPQHAQSFTHHVPQQSMAQQNAHPAVPVTSNPNQLHYSQPIQQVQHVQHAQSTQQGYTQVQHQPQHSQSFLQSVPQPMTHQNTHSHVQTAQQPIPQSVPCAAYTTDPKLGYACNQAPQPPVTHATHVTTQQVRVEQPIPPRNDHEVGNNMKLFAQLQQTQEQVKHLQDRLDATVASSERKQLKQFCTKNPAIRLNNDMTVECLEKELFKAQQNEDLETNQDADAGASNSDHDESDSSHEPEKTKTAGRSRKRGRRGRGSAKRDEVKKSAQSWRLAVSGFRNKKWKFSDLKAYLIRKKYVKNAEDIIFGRKLEQTKDDTQYPIFMIDLKTQAVRDELVKMFRDEKLTSYGI